MPSDLPVRYSQAPESVESNPVYAKFSALAKGFSRVANVAERLIENLESPTGKRISIVVAPTGTGKSTWIPYRILKSEVVARGGRVCVTQPRTITLRRGDDGSDGASIPHFIARELLRAPPISGEIIGRGQEIGLRHSKDTDRYDRNNSLLFTTDGTVINWIVSGELERFDVLVVDEVHEQSENIELILALLKCRMPLFPSLKVVLASATIDVNRFVEFFGSDDVAVFLPQQTDNSTRHTIHRRWPAEWNTPEQCEFPEDNDEGKLDADQQAKNAPTLIAHVVKRLLEEDSFSRLSTPGDILVFVPTVNLVQQTIEALRPLGPQDQLRLVPCHAEMKPKQVRLLREALKAARDARENINRSVSRTVYVATTYAETSVTFPNLRHVVDTGLVMRPTWHTGAAAWRYQVQWHSQAGVTQRCGRVGRDEDGEVFHLYSERCFNTLDETPRPELETAPLDTFLLKAKSAGVEDLSSLEWPSRDLRGDDADIGAEFQRSIEVLNNRETLDHDGDLTSRGVELSGINADSVDVAFCLSEADAFGCTLELASFLAFIAQRGTPFTDDLDGAVAYARWSHGCRDDLDFALRLLFAWTNPDPDHAGIEPGFMKGVIRQRDLFLRTFERGSHTSATTRVFDLNRLHRARLVIASALPEWTYIATPDGRTFAPFSPKCPSDRPISVDRDSCCAPLASKIEAFVALSRSIDRKGELRARHVVVVLLDWLKGAIASGPISQAIMLRRYLLESNSDTAANSTRIVTTAPPTVSQALRRNVSGPLFRLLDRREKAKSSERSDSATAVIIDSRTHTPVVVQLQSDTSTLGKTVRATPNRSQSKKNSGLFVRANQEEYIREYLNKAGKKLVATVLHVVLTDHGHVQYVVLALEPGIEGILFPEKTHVAMWRSLSEASIGKPCLVSVLPPADQRSDKRKQTDRLRLQTVAFACGRLRIVDDGIPFKAIIHSARLDNSGLPSAFNVERSPGHLYTLDVTDLPDAWTKATRTWQVGQTVEVFVVNRRTKSVAPKPLMDREFAQFVLGRRFQVTVARVLESVAFVHLTPRIDAIIPLGEISWTPIDSASQHLSEGQRVIAEVIDRTPQCYKVCMSIKRTMPHPWELSDTPEPSTELSRKLDPWSLISTDTPDGEIPQLPIKLERARQQISTCLDAVLKRRRRFFGSLIASSQLDEVYSRLQNIARTIDELCNYLAYRPHLVERYKQSLQLKIQLHQQYNKQVNIKSVTEKISETDYNLLALVSTFNQQLRSLRRYLAWHIIIVVPSTFPLPDDLPLDCATLRPLRLHK